jgi:hypothetical protein
LEDAQRYQLIELRTDPRGRTYVFPEPSKQT